MRSAMGAQSAGLLLAAATARRWIYDELERWSRAGYERDEITQGQAGERALRDYLIQAR